MPDLDRAYREENIPECYRLIQNLPVEVPFRLADTVLEMVTAKPAEVELMRTSLAKRREMGLVAVGDKEEIIPGSLYGVSPRDVNTMLAKLGGFDNVGFYAHTHWDTDLMPLPSRGDIFNWSFIRTVNPLLECRVAIMLGGEIKVMRFLGKSGN